MLSDPVLWCQDAQETARSGPWQAVALTWDEDDMNYAAGDREQHERWEGVINRASPYFPQVGGPPSLECNKRTEVSLRHTPPIRFYYSAVDRRMHLLGASLGWLKIDYDFDGKVDMEMKYSDTNDNGIFDKWEIVGDGGMNQVVVAAEERATVLTLEYAPLAKFYVEKLHETIRESELLLGMIKQILSDGSERPVEKTYLAPSAASQSATSDRARRSLEFRRFYLDVLLRRYVGDLRVWLEQKNYDTRMISEIAELFNLGQYRQLEALLQRVIG
jgi:hypothetical protein